MSHLIPKPPVKKDYPLWWHAASGRWCRKIGGKRYYFPGSPDEALTEWLRVKDALLAGRPRPLKGGGLTVVELVDAFLVYKSRLRDSGELTPRTFDRYYATARAVVDCLGRSQPVSAVTVADLERLRATLGKRWGVAALANELGTVRSILKYGFDSALMDRPLRTGAALKRPAARLLRQNKARKFRMFEIHELRPVLEKATPIMRAAILLGVGAGYGNADIASLTIVQAETAIRTGWIQHARGKTGVGRRCPVWPETREALKEALEARPEPKGPEAAELFFLGRFGDAMDAERRGNDLAGRFRRLVERAGVHRPGLNFYALRHTCQTIGEGAGDLVALDAILGHIAPQNDMRATYRERIDDSRLQRVADHIRGWVFAPPPAEGEQPAVVPFSTKIG